MGYNSTVLNFSFAQFTPQTRIYNRVLTVGEMTTLQSTGPTVKVSCRYDCVSFFVQFNM